MKRPNSSDSLGEDQNQGNSHMYGREYQAIYDEDGCLDECGPKKRRLNIDQVKALEKNFEVENKLEPDRKVKLAHDLGLQPRQVAVWFQNRRARWKTKQLERDYEVLKANFDALKCNYESVQNVNDALAKEIQELKSQLKDDKSESTVSAKRELIVSETRTWLLNRVVAKLIQELKSKLKDDKSESTISVKTEMIVSETNNLVIEQISCKPQSVSSPSISDQPQTDLDYDVYNNNHASIFKDGSGSGASDSSESSAILNDESSAAISSFLNLLSNHATNSYQFSETKIILGDAQKAYQPQFVKIEEHNFFCGDEACNFFSEDQAPTLQWFSSDQWS